MSKSAQRVTDEQIAKMYSKRGCSVSSTCEALGITRQTFYNRVKKSAKLAEQIAEADESILDWAESRLLEKIKEGDTTSLIFLLKTKGKRRGYVERVENEVSINPFEEIMMSVND